MRVLIVRVGAMGDVLHALPAAAALKATRPDVEIDWIIDQRWRPLLTDGDQAGPVVSTSFSADTRAWKAKPVSPATLGDLARFRRLSGRYDFVVDMQGTMRSALLGRLASRRGQLAGYADPREPLAARFYARKITRRGMHVVEQGAALLGEALGMELAARACSLPLVPAAESWAEKDAVLRRPLALLAPGGGWAAKHWPLERYAEAAQGLRERGYDVVVNAAREDSPEARALLEQARGAARVVVSDVAGLIALMRRTDLVIGGDTGPVHLAAALAVPTVALFGPTRPERNGPWGPGPKAVLRDPASPNSYKRSERPDPGLERITVEQVLGAADGLRG